MKNWNVTALSQSDCKIFLRYWINKQWSWRLLSNESVIFVRYILHGISCARHRIICWVFMPNFFIGQGRNDVLLLSQWFWSLVRALQFGSRKKLPFASPPSRKAWNIKACGIRRLLWSQLCKDFQFLKVLWKLWKTAYQCLRLRWAQMIILISGKRTSKVCWSPRLD